MSLTELLEKNEEIIVEEAYVTLERAHLKHYLACSVKQNRQRLKRLYHIVFFCIKKRTLIPITEYFQNIAIKRFMSGFDCLEVFTAINTLEETIMKKIAKELQPSILSVALGTIFKVFEAAKNSFTRTYVSMASKTNVHKVDLSSLFKGTESNYAN